ncbi:MAG: diacylglycerol kinase family lipid kinase [Gemmatimonadetes bacterium]|nr:diacylglycerol kinase family lipid kinase [Gemmatimonadota bacterium]MYA65455.1 diacylglycerol kinase family lipid kinase [Gemmatimonadota bacterium]MYB99758.1 diacylglycerol kinase family lipid kinase [Gemmatimonadota bacterium]MYH53146.1 diacylglycerol kinase family lipid kinase [Gemmatimonadota bacterium]MYI46609.1 diacylglycerol kinase family lipid kinase [Gemmatimonadota bacterium]
MPREPLRVIVNPAAAGGRGRKAARELFGALDGRSLVYDAHHTEAPGHASRLAAEAVADGVDRIVVVGGDGTVHEVADGLIGCGAKEPPAVAVFPVGTGNDFYRMVGPDRGVAAVMGLLDNGTVRRFDVGRVEWDGGNRTFVNLMGVGIDVEVLRCRGRFARLPGLLQYLASFLNALVTFRAPEVHIDTDGGEGQRITGATTLTVITVGPSIGGGFMINPEAQASDGKLDLFHVGAPGVVPILRLVPRVIRGTHGGSPLVTMRRLSRAVLRRPGGESMWFEIDGELSPEPARELRVEVVPGAFPVLVPARAA